MATAQIDPDGELLLAPIIPPPSEGYENIELTDEQIVGLGTGTLVWNPETRATEANPGYTDPATAKANRRTLERQAATAFQSNRDFLDLATPTNAQVLAQVKALTRQNNGIIRLLLGRLEGTD